VSDEQQTPRVLAQRDYRVAAQARELLRAFNRTTDDIARRHGLTPQRYLLLLLIKGADGGRERATVEDLAARARLAPSTVRELLARAHTAGLVADTGDGTVRLTEDGERLLARTVAETIPARERLTRELAAVEAEDG
jgi:DNA-binding MarR family transcriptional regulator